MELTCLTSWLKFDKSPTDDFINSNNWQIYGSPTIGTDNAINGNALQLDGSSYLKLSNVDFGGQKFAIDGWVYVNPTSPDNARIINIVNPSNGYHMLSVRKSKSATDYIDCWSNSYSEVSANSGKTCTTTTKSVGVKIHFRISVGYLYSSPALFLTINGKSDVYNVIPSDMYCRQKFDIYIGANPNGSQGLIGSIDELRIYDGVNLPLNNYSLPTVDFYKLPAPLSVAFSTKRNVKNPPMTWRYENPGTADLLTQAGTTVTNLDEAQSKAGTAFYQPTRAKCFDIPNTKEIWLKCDIYTTANYANNDRIRIYSEDSNGINGWCTYATVTNNYALWHNGTSQAGTNYLAKSKLRPILLHMVSDATNGVVEYFFANDDTDKFVGNVNAGDDFANVYIQMDGSNILVSNLIISNAPLDIDDDVAELRQKAVEFTADTRLIINKTLTLPIETSRNVIKSTEINFSLRRDVVQSLQVTATTKREIRRSLELLFGTVREVTSANLTPVEKYFDVVRNITKAVTVLNDAERKVVESVAFANDTERKIVFGISCNFNTCRSITNAITVFADTKRLTSNLIEVNFDTLCKVQNIWRIENYGTADLTDDSETETLKVGYSKSRTGFAYRAGYAWYDIPESKEVWIKLDFYFDSDKLVGKPDFKELAVGALKPQKGVLQNQTVFIGEQPSYGLINVNLPNGKDFRNAEYRGAEDFENPIEYNRLYRLLVHIKSDSSEGVIEYWLDNGKHLSCVDNVNNGGDFTRAYARILRFRHYSPLISNVIISNKPVGINEDVAEAGGSVAEFYSTVRKVLNPPLTWTYKNYGTKDLILVEGRNYDNLNITQSRTGAAFTTFEKAKTFQINSAYEIWAKFDFYAENLRNYYDWNNPDVKGTAWGLRFFNLGLNPEEDDLEISAGIEIYAPGSAAWCKISPISGTEDIVEIDGYSQYQYISLAELNDLNNCLLYMKSGTTDGVIKVWINGDLKLWHVGNVNNGNIFDNISLYSVYDFKDVSSTSQTVAYSQTATLFSNVKISNSELAASRNIELLSDTIRKLTGTKETLFDTDRRLICAGIWRYENYGTKKLISRISSEVKCEKAKSLYYQGFHQPNRLRCFDIPSEKELWVKFDVYTTLSKRWRAYNDTSDDATNGICSQTNGNLDFWAQDNNVITCSNVVKNQRQTVLLHMVSDGTNGVIEAWLDGNLLNTYTGNVNNGEDFNNFYLQSDGEDTFFSNVIISNNQIGLNENAKMIFKGFYDVNISVPKAIASHFGIVRNVAISQNIRVDLLREVKYLIKIFNDTCRDLAPSVRVDFDTARSIPHKIRVMPIPVADFSTNQNNVNSTAQTQRLKKISLLADNPAIVVNPSTDEITDGTQSLEISLTAQQLTDQITYTGINPAAIMEEVQGQYLDHKFDVRIEKISKRGVLYTYKCCTDIDEILYRQLDYQIPDDEQWHRTGDNPDEEIYDYIPMSNASVHISHISENMGKQPVLFFADFVSTVDVAAGGVTYHDLISSIFGWTSRVPNMLINVFIRDNKMFVVQRGHEPNTIDLTDTRHTLPNVDCEIMRTAWGAKTWAETETRERRGRLVLDHYEFGPAPGGGSSGGGRVDGYTYDDDGLVTKSVKTEGNTETTTYYDYITLENGRKVLATERTVVYENGTKIDETTTSHTYLGQGQSHSTTYDSDGDYRGGTVGQNTGDDRVSPLISDKASGWYVYDNGEKKYIKSRIMKYEKIPEERKIYGITLFDTSFPVHDDDKLAEITSHINWLNRRTQETISMSIYAYPHLIDFTDKIVFEGNEYFLVSNTATTTTRIINRQDVTFVRWY